MQAGGMAGPATVNGAITLGSDASIGINSSVVGLSITGGVSGTGNLTIANTIQLRLLFPDLQSIIPALSPPAGTSTAAY